MANIKLVIELDEDITKGIIDGGNDAPRIIIRDCQETIADAIKNGTPLPKGHGRLVDVDKCNRKLFYQQCGGSDSLITVKSAFNMLMSLPTVIDADKESE